MFSYYKYFFLLLIIFKNTYGNLSLYKCTNYQEGDCMIQFLRIGSFFTRLLKQKKKSFFFTFFFSHYNLYTENFHIYPLYFLFQNYQAFVLFPPCLFWICYTTSFHIFTFLYPMHKKEFIKNQFSKCLVYWILS